MPVCVRCKTMLPPNFVENTEDGKEKVCIFCIRNTDTIKYGADKEKTATRKQIAEEYRIYMKMVVESDDKLKEFKSGIIDSDVIKIET